jgi:alpha-L-fucosidase
MDQMKYFSFTFIILLIFNIAAFSQDESKSNYLIINPGDTPEEIIEKASNVTPSKRQYEWQKLELTGFIHFGINTFNEVEWGERNTDITKFNPSEIDVKQWVKVFKDAGIKLIILTTKHHDGFCLWPSKYTDYNILNTPFQDGRGDIVKDLSNACLEAGIKFGVYLSPWDMHEKTYGTPEYNKHFMNQLTELLTNYGEISEVWFDGANGEGPNGRRQVYDWHSYYKLIRKLQPDAVIAIMGPDVRWVGTESGYGRQTEWSVLPGSAMDQNTIEANSQQQLLDGAFVPRDLTDEDLGSRKKIENASSLIWYPAEIDVSIRPGWFYHNGDDDMVKSPYKLVDIYYNSVGLNGVLLLNVPPDKRGLFHENDIGALQGMRYILDETFKVNLVQNANAIASNEKRGKEAGFILDNDMKTYWTTEEKIYSATIEIELNKEETFNCAMLQENILVGQRIEKFHLEWWDGKNWSSFAEGTTVGYKRLLRFPAITAGKIKIVIDECRTNPTLSSFGLYLSPPEVRFEPDGGTFSDSISFKLISDTKNTKIYYTLGGGSPDENSIKYSDKVSLNETIIVTAIAVSGDGRKGLPVTTVFNKAKYGIELKTKYDNKYPGQGMYTVIDGVHGSSNFNDGRWLGYNGNNFEAVIDLGKIKPVHKISSSFLSNTNSWIFLPASVEYSISDDGKIFTPVKEISHDIREREKRAFVHTFESDSLNISGRYLHTKANNIKVCPPWHKGAGDKAWLFIDEITIK